MKIGFDIDQEGWNVYQLEDGTTVRSRIVLVAVRRREGEFDQSGAPKYEFDCQQIVHVEAPAHLCVPIHSEHPVTQ